MAAAYDNTATMVSAVASPASVSITPVASCSLIVVVVACKPAGLTVTGVTIGGGAATQIGTVAGSSGKAELWAREATFASGAAVSCVATVTGSISRVQVSAMSFTGATVAGKTAANASGSGTAIAGAAPSDGGTLSVSACDQVNTTTTFTATGTGQVRRTYLSAGSGATTNTGAGSTGNANTAHSYTSSATGAWGITTINIADSGPATPKSLVAPMRAQRHPLLRR